MAKAGTLLIDIAASTARLEKDLSQATGMLQRSGQRMQSLAKGIGAGLIAGFSVQALASFAKSTIDTADKLAKLSQSVGVSVEQLSGLSHAANLSDVEIEKLGKALGKLSVNMSDTVKGTGDAKDAFRALGIDVQQTDGALKNPDTVLKEVAAKFASMEDGAGKTALAIKIFGRAGADLIPLLNAGADGIAEMQEEAKRLGLVLSTEAAQAAERFNDNLTRVHGLVQGSANSIMVGLVPALENLTNILAEASTDQEAMEETGKALAAGLNTIATAAYLAGDAFSFYGKNIGATAAAISFVLEGEFSAAADVISQRFKDAVADAEQSRETIARIWSDIEGKPVEKTGKKTKAPNIPGTPKSGGKSSAEKLAEEWARTQKDLVLDTDRLGMDDFERKLSEIVERVGDLNDKFGDKKEITDYFNTAVLQAYTEETTKAAEAAKKLDAEIAKAESEGLARSEERLERMAEANAEISKLVEEAWRSAYEGMQQVAADFFDSAMQGDLKTMEDWGNAITGVIRRVVAEWLAAQMMMKGAQILGMAVGAVGGFGGAPSAMTAAGASNSFTSGSDFLLSNIPARAAGGPVSAGSLYRVNEHGIEGFQPSGSGQIIPLGEMKGQSGGNFTVNVYPRDFESFQSPQNQAMLSARMRRMQQSAQRNV